MSTMDSDHYFSRTGLGWDESTITSKSFPFMAAEGTQDRWGSGFPVPVRSLGSRCLCDSPMLLLQKISLGAFVNLKPSHWKASLELWKGSRGSPHGVGGRMMQRFQSLSIISFSLPPILLFPHLSLSQIKLFVAPWKNRDPWCGSLWGRPSGETFFFWISRVSLHSLNIWGHELIFLANLSCIVDSLRLSSPC